MTDTEQAIEAYKTIKGLSDTTPILSFVETTEAFIKALNTVSALDRPKVTVLQHLAQQLDSDGVGNAQMVNQYRLTMNELLKRSLQDSPPVDEDEAFLNGQ